MSDDAAVVVKPFHIGGKKKTTAGEQCKRICIVHYPQIKGHELKPLSEKAFKVIQSAKDLRSKTSNILHQLTDICKDIPLLYDRERHGIHSWCYANFTNTARVKIDRITPKPVIDSPRKTRAKTGITSAHQVHGTHGSALLPRFCIFCHKGPTTKNGKFARLIKCASVAAAKNIFESAKRKNDFLLLGRLVSVDLAVAAEAHYHEHCRSQYNLRDDRRSRTSSCPTAAPAETDNADDGFVQGCAEHRAAYEAAFQDVCVFITEHIIADGGVVRMTTLRERYLQHVQHNASSFYNPDYRTHTLKRRIERRFGDQVKFWRPNNKSELLYSAEVETGVAVEAAFETATSEAQILNDAALILHRSIMDSHRNDSDMPWPPSATFLSSSAALPPVILTDFITRVISTKSPELASERNKRIASSLAEDICAAATCGRWKMPKHLLLGMALRHFTGSAQVITLVNRFGHCSSHSQILELETAMAIQTKQHSSVLPHNISVSCNKFLHTCFDNFDILEETASGAGTTHTTHGIVIQELKADAVVYDVTETHVERSKQRSIKFVEEELRPCFSRRRVEPIVTESPSGYYQFDPQECAIKPGDLLWTLCRGFYNRSCRVPTWAGWLSMTARSDVAEPVQLSVIGFLPPILHPITDYATVQQCLANAMAASQEVAQKYTFVTMDLAAAKMAFDVKFDRPDQYKDVIIHLGGFHIMCSYMGALGKMMAGSGFEDLIIEAGVCASGSIEKVLSGKHFNRAMRVHQLMLDATERLLMQSFLKHCDTAALPAAFDDVLTDLSPDALIKLLSTDEFASFHLAYADYRGDVRTGKFGSTPQFWLLYMESVWHLLHFQESIKKNDFDMYLSSIYHLCGLLFSADHVNYARYLPLYYFQLLNLPTTHSGAQELLRDKGFSVARSTVSCCRNPVDITIEQTINRSAKTSGGIIGFSRNVSAYYRWCVTRHQRAMYTQATLERADMAPNMTDVHSSLRPAELRNSETAVGRLLETFQLFSNPFMFEKQQMETLYCISSGQPASAAVCNDLLKYVDRGHEAADAFIESRLVQKTVKFQDAVKRNNYKTFKAMAVKQTMSSSKKKAVVIKAERNLLGSLLLMSQQNDISLSKLFCFPLGPIPWSLATADGTMVKTNKSTLLNHLESLGKSQPSTMPSLDSSSAHVIDGNALLQSCVAIPETFEDFAEQIFCRLPKCGTVHFVTDTYKPDSIKGFERRRRGDSATFNVGGPKTKMPRDFKAFMLNATNKQQLIKFLHQEWSSQKYALRLRGRQLYFAYEEDCVCLRSSEGLHTSSTPVASLSSNQEEADTRIILHCLHQNNDPLCTSITVRSPDTDVLILLIAYSDDIKPVLLFDTGTGNKQRIIDVKSISTELGSAAATALPGLHAFTGCDCTSAFVQRGKVKPLKLLLECPNFASVFQKLGSSLSLDGDVLNQLENFVCSMYGKPKDSDVNKVRYDIFSSRYETKTDSSNFAIAGGIDLSLLPPCRSSLALHAARANYVAYLWKNPQMAQIDIPSPIGHGWMEASDSGLAVQWTSGNILPQQLVDILANDAEHDVDNSALVEQEVEEDCELDNIVDDIFDDEDND